MVEYSVNMVEGIEEGGLQRNGTFRGSSDRTWARKEGGTSWKPWGKGHMDGCLNARVYIGKFVGTLGTGSMGRIRAVDCLGVSGSARLV